MAKNPPFAALYRSLLAGPIGEIDASRQFPPDHLAELQNARLAALLRDAGHSVRYYNRLLRQHGVMSTEGDIDLERFPALPTLSKFDIREAGDDLRSDRPRPGTRWNASGGSTGEPVRIAQDAAHRNASRAAKFVFDGWSGYRFGLPRIVVWGSPRDRLAGRAWWRPALRRLKREVWLDAYTMSPEDIDRHIATIEAIRPVNILGYAESLHEMARHLLARGTSLPPCAGIVSTAGTLFPDARADIERAFQSPVFNRYGSRETGEMAGECSAHNGLHVSPLTHYIEILRPDGTPCAVGERGEIVVTPLANRAMPLIRYRIGDEAAFAPGACACGCTWPRLLTVHGRTTDHVVSPTNGKIYGGAFRFIVNTLNWVQHYQVVQTEASAISIRLAPLPGIDAAAALRRDTPMIAARAADLMGPGCRIDIVLVDAIAPTASGKRRHVIGDIAAPAGPDLGNRMAP
jgi:phenylacetate-CoA ligase